MKLYVRFENVESGRQVEALRADTPPNEGVWFEAPEENTVVQRLNGNIVEWTEADQAELEIKDALAEAKRQIKAIAAQIIVSVMPEHKQRNYLALGLNASLEHGNDTSIWPAELQAELSKAAPLWAFIQEVRSYSNTAEELISQAADNGGPTERKMGIETALNGLVWPTVPKPNV